MQQAPWERCGSINYMADKRYNLNVHLHGRAVQHAVQQLLRPVRTHCKTFHGQWLIRKATVYCNVSSSWSLLVLSRHVSPVHVLKVADADVSAGPEALATQTT